MSRILSLAILIFLAGCATTKPISPPKVVQVAVERIVPVPAALTEPCQQHEPKAKTVQEAVRLANVRKAALDECSARMKRIRDLAQPR